MKKKINRNLKITLDWVVIFKYKERSMLELFFSLIFPQISIIRKSVSIKDYTHAYGNSYKLKVIRCNTSLFCKNSNLISQIQPQPCLPSSIVHAVPHPSCNTGTSWLKIGNHPFGSFLHTPYILCCTALFELQSPNVSTYSLPSFLKIVTYITS